MALVIFIIKDSIATSGAGQVLTEKTKNKHVKSGYLENEA